MLTVKKLWFKKVLVGLFLLSLILDALFTNVSPTLITEQFAMMSIFTTFFAIWICAFVLFSSFDKQSKEIRSSHNLKVGYKTKFSVLRTFFRQEYKIVFVMVLGVKLMHIYLTHHFYVESSVFPEFDTYSFTFDNEKCVLFVQDETILRAKEECETWIQTFHIRFARAMSLLSALNLFICFLCLPIHYRFLLKLKESGIT